MTPSCLTSDLYDVIHINLIIYLDSEDMLVDRMLQVVSEHRV